jgi:cytochrome c oxidase assembly protein subunit 15
VGTLETKHSRWLHRYATFLACVTLLLIVAGALVTSNDAGLSVPDWPTSFGSFRMPRMVGGVRYEHGHRMIAGAVGLLTIVLALWLWRSEPRGWVRKLGGITVLFYLPVAISVGHATLAQLFFCVTVSLALFTGADWRWDEPTIEDSLSPSLRQLTAVTTLGILFQLVLGAAFRHNGFGIVPHLVVAALVTVGILWAAARALALSPREARLSRAALLLAGLLIVQIGLGVSAYWMKLLARDAPQPLPAVVAVTTAHVAVGALVLAASLVLTLETYRLLRAPGQAGSLPRATLRTVTQDSGTV